MHSRPPRHWSLLAFFFLLPLSGLTPAAHARSSPLAPAPDWSWLDSCNGAFTREQFLQALDEIYAPGGTAAAWIEVGDQAARVRIDSENWKEVTFAKGGSPPNKGPSRFWRRPFEMEPAAAEQPLKGVKIAIDPGHLGGEWAQMEARFFQIGKTRPVAEGDLTMAVASKLKPLLEKRGAVVSLLRKGDKPATKERPKTLQPAALADLAGNITPERVRTHSELFFYRISEIRARAQQVNERIKPDMVLCLHFNAEEWGDPASPQLQPRNHLHALVNGCFGAKELEWDDIRAEMLGNLFSRVSEEAIPLSTAVVDGLAAESGLPPFIYFSPNAKRVGDSPYLYARNLLANRLYKAPVVFLEPYVMNSEPVWKRVQLGDYRGERILDGVARKSLVNEYATGVVEGLSNYYRKERGSRASATSASSPPK